MQQAVRHRIRAHSKRLLDLAGSTGHDVWDNDERLCAKRVAVVVFGGTLLLTIAWSAIYLAVGAPLAAAVPGFYCVITPINTLATLALDRRGFFYGRSALGSAGHCHGSDSFSAIAGPLVQLFVLRSDARDIWPLCRTMGWS
jgi:hypothetical protein